MLEHPHDDVPDRLAAFAAAPAAALPGAAAARRHGEQRRRRSRVALALSGAAAVAAAFTIAAALGSGEDRITTPGATPEGSAGPSAGGSTRPLDARVGHRR